MSSREGDEGRTRAGKTASAAGSRKTLLLGTRLLLAATTGSAALLAGDLASGASPSPPSTPPAGMDTISFRHVDHRGLDCQTCHASGRATVNAPQEWCASCHHSGQGFSSCGNCHTSAALGRLRTVERRITVAERDVERRMPFDHARHSGFGCGECHGAPMPRVRTECVDCHESHHALRADCVACHRDPPTGAHELAVHTEGCGGSNCHGEAVVALEEGMHETRGVCLSCHQAQRGHEEGEVCTGCHLLPRRDQTSEEDPERTDARDSVPGDPGW